MHLGHLYEQTWGGGLVVMTTKIKADRNRYLFYFETRMLDIL